MRPPALGVGRSLAYTSSWRASTPSPRCSAGARADAVRRLQCGEPERAGAHVARCRVVRFEPTQCTRRSSDSPEAGATNMLNRLRLENFKAWREVDLRLGKVTGLFGTNSSGKSSLLQLLLLLKQTSNATDRGLVLDLGGPADIVNLGTFKDAIHLHDESQRMRWLLRPRRGNGTFRRRWRSVNRRATRMTCCSKAIVLRCDVRWACDNRDCGSTSWRTGSTAPTLNCDRSVAPERSSTWQQMAKNSRSSAT